MDDVPRVSEVARAGVAATASADGSTRLFDKLPKEVRSLHDRLFRIASGVVF
jgi:hypothetical protein